MVFQSLESRWRDERRGKWGLQVIQNKKMKQLGSIKNWRRDFVLDILIALSWMVLLGMPLFMVHMLVFDYEHYLHRVQDVFSIEQSLAEMLPRHSVSLLLWLTMIWITTFAVLRVMRHREQMVAIQARLALSQTQALTDGLTGVWNRRGFERLFKSTFERAQQSQQSFSIILADVDGLKGYNDSFGHPAADDALRTITQLLIGNLRAVDAVARYGGDEFVIFCPQLNRDGAERLVTRLRAAMTIAPLSLSFGIATFPEDGNTATALISVADHRLYEAKARQHARQRPPNHPPDCLCIDCKCAMFPPPSQSFTSSSDAL